MPRVCEQIVVVQREKKGGRQAKKDDRIGGYGMEWTEYALSSNVNTVRTTKRKWEEGKKWWERGREGEYKHHLSP